MADAARSSSASAAVEGVAVPEASAPGMHSFRIRNVVFTVDSRYTPLRSLGSGAYGAVCSAIDTAAAPAAGSAAAGSAAAGSAADPAAGERVAIKKVTRAFDDLVDSKRILREMKLLRHLKHDNIVGLRDLVPPGPTTAFEDVYMVLDYMETDLHRIIHSRNTLTDEHVQYFVYQILKALKYIHSANVIHRDLKPSNVLINGNCDLKICDFGLARGLRHGDDSIELSEYVVTRWYRAPEIMCASQQYDEKIDVWSLGCIMAEIIGRRPLFAGEDYLQQVDLIISVLGTPSAEDMEIVTTDQARRYILRQRRRPPVPLERLFPEATPLALDLLSRMLVFDPRKRMSVEEALAHPYLARYRDEARETVCPTPFNFDFERIKMTKPVLQAFMMDEIVAFRPGVRSSPSVAPHLEACDRYMRRVREEVSKAQQQQQQLLQAEPMVLEGHHVARASAAVGGAGERYEGPCTPGGTAQMDVDPSEGPAASEASGEAAADADKLRGATAASAVPQEGADTSVFRALAGV